MHTTYVSHDNLDSVNLLMMWDSQGENLAQGCLSHVACQELSRRQFLTNDANIKQHLLPALEVLLMVMLKPAHMSLADVDAFAEAVVQIHNFFSCFDWERTWASPLVSSNSCESTLHPPSTGYLRFSPLALQHFALMRCL